MSLFHLEEYLKTATSLEDVAGVYWCARDMGSFFLGNHHFVLFIYESEEQAKIVTKRWGRWTLGYLTLKNDEGLDIYYTTFGVARDGDGNIKIVFNPSLDSIALREVAQEDATSYLLPDSDLEAHRIPLIEEYEDYEQLMNEMLLRTYIFMKYYDAGFKVSYSLVDRNCEAFVNTLLKVCRYDAKLREELGEFEGIDWGEEGLLPESLFYMVFPANTKKKEIHTPFCQWARKISREHRTLFYSPQEGLKEGYNGCYYCMREFDTDRPSYTLELLSIKCKSTEDFWGADEIYIMVGNSIVWGPTKMKDGDKQKLNLPPIFFEKSVRIRLFDRDSGITVFGMGDKDDLLGDHIIIGKNVGNGEQREARFNLDDADYILKYRVVTNS